MNPRGRQIEQVLSDHCLCLINHDEPTYFHEPTRFFHTLNLAICSPSLFPNSNLSIVKDLYNSDHFPVILSHYYDTGGKTFPPTYSYGRAGGALFTQLAVITDAMVKTESVDTAVQEVTNVLIAAADLSIPKVSSHSFQRYKPWWNTDCQTAYMKQQKLWGIFRRYPTTENLLAFKKAKANARRVRRQSQRQSWIRYVSSLTSSTSSKQLWKKSLEGAFSSSWRKAIVIPILKPGKVVTDPLSYRSIALTSCFCKTFEPVRYFNVRIGHSSSHKFRQDQGVPQGSVLRVTLFNIHISNILHQLPPSVRGMLYVDDLQVSCQGSDMRLIERQLQTTVNRLVKWCDQNGHTISPSKSSCVHFCRKLSLLRVYQALILSRLDYGCVVYGSARASVLKRLDTIHHSALRICSGAFRTSPVTSLYVVCHQPPLELRRRQLSANYFIRAMSVPSHPIKPFALVIGHNRLYEARSFNITPFSERAKAVLNDAHLNNINNQENNILAFPPWDIQIFNYHNPFSGYHKAGTADVIYQQLFTFHRSKYSKYIPVYTDGSKAVGHSVDTPTVIEILILLRKLEKKGFDIIFSWIPGHVGILGNEQADTAARSMSDHMQRPVCYQDLKTSTQNYIHRVWQGTWDQQILNKLHSINPSTFYWTALPVRRHDVRLTRLRIGHTRFTHRHLLLAWSKLALAPLKLTIITHSAALPVRRHDVRLTRLRIGHTRFTHRHLLLGENAPECPSCKVPYSVYHILIDCPVFNRHHVTFFHRSVLTLSDLVEESPHQNLFAFVLKIGFLHMI
ncbi:putative RNA-directed DNA polymerase from transposon X-element [Trichonephila clavipes]|nr:putative RNA-directed DNA polymerase from transposon X-element [Trichonephila clavipes]